MNWCDIGFLRDYFNIRPIDFTRFIGYDESTVRKKIKEQKEFNPPRNVLKKILILFLANDRTKENLKNLITELKDKNYSNHTSRNYVNSRIQINNSINQIRDKELEITELFLHGYSLFDRKESELDIDNEFIELLNKIADNPTALKYFINSYHKKNYIDFNINRSIILSFNIEYNAFDSCYPRPIIKDYHLKIPSAYEDINYDLQTFGTDKDGKEGDRYIKFLENIDKEINENIKDEKGYIGFKEFVLYLNKIYKKYLIILKSGFVMYTDGFDCELEFLKKHLDYYGKSILKRIPILKLNDYIGHGDTFIQKGELNLYEIASALNIQCSLEKVFKSCEYRNEIINELINILYLRKADKSNRDLEINEVFGSNEEYVKAYFKDDKKAHELLIDKRRQIYKS